MSNQCCADCIAYDDTNEYCGARGVNTVAEAEACPMIIASTKQEE